MVISRFKESIELYFETINVRRAQTTIMAGRKVDMKIVLLGREYGGKTSLVERYLHDRFTGDMPYQSTIGAAFGAKRLEVGNRTITLGIWDTAGSERYEAMSRIYYRGAKAAIVCYDLTDINSYDRAQFWISELQKNEESCRIYLCGTKKDIIDSDKNRRQVDYHTTTDLADEVSGEVFETSSKTGENIRELFSKIALDYVNDPSSTEIQENNGAFEIRDSPKKSLCCS